MSRAVPWEFLGKYKGTFFEGEWPTLPEMFRITAERYPERPCLTIFAPERSTLSYKETLAKIERVAGFLAGQGLKRGDTIAVSGKNSPEWAVAYLSVLFAGYTVVPIDYQLPQEEIENILKVSDSAALFIDEEKYDGLRHCGISRYWSLSPAKPDYIYALSNPGAPALEGPSENDVAAILFTSGTTGNPKGAMITHRNFVSDCYLAQANLNIFHTDVFYALLPIHHAYTMLAVFIEALSVGAELVFGQRMVTTAILRELKEAKVTMFLGVPLLFNKVLAGIMRGIKAKGLFVYGLLSVLMAISGFIKKAFKINPGKKMFGSVLDKASLRSIRICICGGGPLAPSVFRKYNQLGIDFVQGYGLTETSPILTLNPTEAYRETSVGKLIPQVEMKILEPDHDGRGEIAVKGPMVMSGYYKNKEATESVFTKDGWFLTGDVGYLDADKYLYLTGRAKNVIVTEGGKNVYPEEIENNFQLYTEVEQILVKGYIMDKREKAEGIEACIYPCMECFEQEAAKQGVTVRDSDIEARIKRIVDEVNAAMLPYQRISKVTVLKDALEMTTTKKIKRHVVK